VSLTFLLGGVRSGKSALATELAGLARGPVTFLATAEARDEEMAKRIALHRAHRPAGWKTVEEPLELDDALAGVEAEAVVIIDCLSLWIANLIERGDADDEIERHSERAVANVGRRSGATIAVSNEVGLGVVPVSALGRRYRDVLGRVNAHWAAAADDAFFVVAGRRLRLQ
jgi:adenosylcobinamide kinase / adenosylcobinamide-phosphate guanylyltransferase